MISVLGEPPLLYVVNLHVQQSVDFSGWQS